MSQQPSAWLDPKLDVVFKAPWATASLRKAVEELQRLEGNEQMRELYEARLDQVRVLATELEGSYVEGLEQGLEQGREQALHAIARRLLQEGETPERVAHLTGLALETIRVL